MQNIILTGFSGTGKTQVAKQLAQYMNWTVIDTDILIEQQEGRSIKEIFKKEGEEKFRTIESKILKEACSALQAIISTGGGAFIRETNRNIMLKSGFVITLDASPNTILDRLKKNSSNPLNERPLLKGNNTLNTITELKRERQYIYSLSHWTIQTDLLDIHSVSKEIIHAWELISGLKIINTGNDINNQGYASKIITEKGECPIYIGSGIVESLGKYCSENNLSSTAYLISDSIVSTQHLRKAQVSLENSYIPTHTLTFPQGEASKNIDTISSIYEWLAQQKTERNHFIVALGGGVVGDISGFVAATYNRGIPFIQVPTSLAAMVDASIGGKTAINLPQGKNLVGAFHQPRMILIDTSFLHTLPPRELNSGWAEAIKHGIIKDSDLFDDFEQNSNSIQKLDSTSSTRVIKASIAIKVAVVNADQYETLGTRALLNYGHTIGHALENSTGYGKLLHGEAVSIGMCFAARISEKMGLINMECVQRQEKLLKKFDLPTYWHNVNHEEIKLAMKVDKKTVGKSIKWILIEKIGKAVARSDVPEDIIEATMKEVL
jgi:3-dehydroquinate synthase